MQYAPEQQVFSQIIISEEAIVDNFLCDLTELKIKLRIFDPILKNNQTYCFGFAIFPVQNYQIYCIST